MKINRFCLPLTYETTGGGGAVADDDTGWG
jgi:hypothetical protein